MKVFFGFMFHISSKGDYGLLFMTYLAQVAEDRFVPLREVATEMKMSEKYLSHIVGSLKKAQLIRSKEGAGGGYKLADTPEKLSVYDIMSALEGAFQPVKCVGDSTWKCKNIDVCMTKAFWNEWSNEAIEILKTKHLSDVLKLHHKS